MTIKAIQLYCLIFAVAFFAVETSCAQLTGIFTSLVPAQGAALSTPVECISVGDVINATPGVHTVKHSLKLSGFNTETGIWEELYSEIGSVTLQPNGSMLGWTMDFSGSNLSPGSYLVNCKRTANCGR